MKKSIIKCTKFPIIIKVGNFYTYTYKDNTSLVLLCIEVTNRGFYKFMIMLSTNENINKDFFTLTECDLESVTEFKDKLVIDCSE